MLIPMHGMKLHAQCYTRWKVYAHCFTWIEALCSFLYMNRSFMLIAIHGVKLYAHYYASSELICSLLYMD